MEYKTEAEAGVHAEINTLRIIIAILSDPEDVHKQDACVHQNGFFLLLSAETSACSDSVLCQMGLTGSSLGITDEHSHLQLRLVTVLQANAEGVMCSHGLWQDALHQPTPPALPPLQTHGWEAQ